ncbi:MAG: hypothetical protein AB1758_09740, partial [Candidatus Eremiobacterota bacterium]
MGRSTTAARRLVPGVLAKLAGPLTRGMVARERLFQGLDTALEGGAVWLEGPPGSGKSTLVGTYLESRGLPCQWYRIDRRDSDPANLFYHLRRAVPGRKSGLPLLTPDFLANLEGFALSWFEQFWASLPASTCLVLDDLHEVGSDGLFRVLREALSALPPGYRLLLVSREGPPGALARERARGRLRWMGWPEIALNLDELGQVAEARAPGLDRQRTEWLHQRCGGWVAGL